MLKIVNVPNTVLTTPVKPVKKIDSSIKKLVKEMEKTLKAQVDPQGVGLAAPQVGVSIALFIMQPSPEENVEVMINPKIKHSESVAKQTEEDEKEHEQLEGCLSIPRIWSPIRRHDKVLLEYQDIEGDTLTKEFDGFEATIVQHEMDHLNGILFTQRAVEQNQDLFEEKKGKLKKIDV
jgi:peptide deformylase